MTEKEEAIIILDGFKDNPLFNEQHKKALDMAISALSEDNTEWVDNEVGDLECHCKKCGQEIFKVQKWFKFCPNCGRKAVQK